MNKYELRRLKQKVKVLNKQDEPIYLKLNNCIYRCRNNSGQLIEVDSIPSNATVEIVDCTADNLVYFFCFNNKPTYVILD